MPCVYRFDASQVFPFLDGHKPPIFSVEETMITILYFGVLKQQLGVAQEQLEWQGGSGRDLLDLLHSRGEDWAAALAEGKVFRLVINKKISAWDDDIADGAEVGLLPPVTGG